MQLEIEDSEQEDTAKPFVEDMLALCAKVPAINQALSDHFHHAPADKWQSAIREIRAQMDEYRPQILESVDNEFKELVAQDRPQLEQTLLEPLRKRDETIKYVITYVDSAYHEQLQTLTCYLQATRKRKGQLLFRCGGHDKAVWAKRPAPSEAAGETTQGHPGPEPGPGQPARHPPGSARHGASCQDQAEGFGAQA